MRQLLVIVILSSLCSASFGQSKVIQIPSNGKKDTSLWFKLKQSDRQELGLTNLLTQQMPLHFRLWEENNAIDIWTEDFRIFNGLLSSFTSRIGDFERDEKSNFFSKKRLLDTTVARIVYCLFVDSSIFRIPTDDSIKGWGQGDDGEEFLLEYSSPEIYSFKEYWTPSAIKNVKEAVVIENVVKRLDTVLDIRRCWNEFVNELPNGCYRVGEMVEICINRSRKDIRRMKKYREKSIVNDTRQLN